MTNIGNGAVVGQVNQGFTPVSANYTVQPIDENVQVTTGSSVIVVTLPAPTKGGTQPGDAGIVNGAGSVGNQGQRVNIQKVDTGAGTVDVKGALNVGKDYSLANRWSAATFLSDGTNWNLVGTVS